MIFFSIIISIRLNSNFIIWIRLELNILRFLPIISTRENIEIENSIKYFLIQRFASVIFLLRFFFLEIILRTLNVFIMIRIFVKLGVSPFHSWFISILKTRSLKILFMLSSVQKFIPLVILNNIIFNYIVFYIIVFLNLMILVYILFSTISFNKILALSSIINIVWLISRNFISLKLIIIFFIIYIYMLSGVIFIYGQVKLGRFFYINSINFFDKFFLILVFISLGGIPPLLGFLRKFIVLKMLISFFNIFFLILIIFSSLILLYFYLSRLYFFLSNLPMIKIRFKINFINFKKLSYLMSLINLNLFFIFFF